MYPHAAPNDHPMAMTVLSCVHMCVGWMGDSTNQNKMATKPKKTLTPARDKLDAYGMDAICARTADCVPMRTIAAEVGVDWSTLSLYINATPDRVQQYARAREAQADKLAEDILAIADDGARDTYTDADGNERTDQDVIARSRLRVDARKWLASKMAPKRYGEKVTQEHTGSDGGPIDMSLTVAFVKPDAG